MRGEDIEYNKRQYKLVLYVLLYYRIKNVFAGRISNRCGWVNKVIWWLLLSKMYDSINILIHNHQYFSTRRDKFAESNKICYLQSGNMFKPSYYSWNITELGLNNYDVEPLCNRINCLINVILVLQVQIFSLLQKHVRLGSLYELKHHYVTIDVFPYIWQFKTLFVWIL